MIATRAKDSSLPYQKLFFVGAKKSLSIRSRTVRRSKQTKLTLIRDPRLPQCLRASISDAECQERPVLASRATLSNFEASRTSQLFLFLLHTYLALRPQLSSEAQGDHHDPAVNVMQLSLIRTCTIFSYTGSFGGDFTLPTFLEPRGLAHSWHHGPQDLKAVVRAHHLSGEPRQ